MIIFIIFLLLPIVSIAGDLPVISANGFVCSRDGIGRVECSVEMKHIIYSAGGDNDVTMSIETATTRSTYSSGTGCLSVVFFDRKSGEISKIANTRRNGEKKYSTPEQLSESILWCMGLK